MGDTAGRRFLRVQKSLVLRGKGGLVYTGRGDSDMPGGGQGDPALGGGSKSDEHM